MTYFEIYTLLQWPGRTLSLTCKCGGVPGHSKSNKSFDAPDDVDVDVDGDHGNKFEGKDIRGRTIQHDDKKEPPAKRAKHSTIESHLAFWDTHYTSLFTRTLRALRIMP